MTSVKQWNPNEVQLNETNATFTYPDVTKFEDGSYEYLDPSLDESMIHEIEPSIVNIKEWMILKIKVTSANMKQLVKLASIDASSMGTDVLDRRTFVSRDKNSQVTEDILAERFRISLKTARAILAATLQNGTRSAILSLSRKYKADRQYNLKRLDGKFSTDTFYSKVRSLIGNTCSQLYTHKCGFSAPYHMPRAKNEHVGGS